MLKYMLLLSCLCAANIGAVKKPIQKLKDSEVLICLAKDAQSGLSSLLDPEHQSLCKIIIIHNKAKALSGLQQPHAYKKWRQTTLNEQFYNMFESKKKMKRFEPFLEELIKNSGDIQINYYGIPDRNIRQQLLNDTEEAIDNVADPVTQAHLQKKINKIHPKK